jgi:hypothetical protein
MARQLPRRQKGQDARRKGRIPDHFSAGDLSAPDSKSPELRQTRVCPDREDGIVPVDGNIQRRERVERQGRAVCF